MNRPRVQPRLCATGIAVLLLARGIAFAAEEAPVSGATTNAVTAFAPAFLVGSLPLRGAALAAPPKPEPAPTPDVVPAPSPNPSEIDAAELSSGEVWARNLAPRQRAEVEALAASLPRYRTDAFEDGLFSKAGDVLFPKIAVVKIGKVSVAGGLVTAVKTRNPFGLLNPLILGIGW